ncbi:MAG: DEAD/DEAH box helicase [Limnochordia bacterium]
MTPSLPLWLAEAAVRYVRGAAIRQVWLARLRVRRLLAAWGRRSAWRQFDPFSYSSSSASDQMDPLPEHRMTAILSILRHRQLLENDFMHAWRERSLGPNPPSGTELQQMVLAGLIERRAAVGLGSFGRFECRRCGGHSSVAVVDCAVCGGECPECRECLSWGVARGCTALLSPGPAEPAPEQGSSPQSVAYRLPFALSPAQASAAEEIQRAIDQGKRRVLVWAACGAGKTEVVYEAMARALTGQGRVLVTTPRRDVAADLCQRLRTAFCSESIAGLYGGASQKYPEARLLVATTHQAVRLGGRFELLVFDECDAFPYTDSPVLQRAIARLAAQAGCFVQMTATPTKLQLQWARQSDSRLVCIPARHHGHPLPVPIVTVDPSLREGSLRDIPVGLKEALVQTLNEGAQLLVFVPRRTLVEPLVAALQREGYRKVTGVYSGSQRRDAVREALVAGTVDVVVSTTVFERGLTFPMVNVAVLYADAEGVFDPAALIQMAGRVGRTPQRPTGRVWFFCARQSPQIREACDAIVTLNTMAKERGLLKP